MKFQLIDQKTFPSNQIAGFFDHQYLLRESINVINVLDRGSHQGTKTLKVVL